MKPQQKQSQWILHLVFIVVSVLCLLPFLLLFTSSITDENEIIQSGYSLFPDKISFAAYGYLFRDASAIVRAYSISILVTVIGTLVSLCIISLLAYPLSRKDLPFRKFLAFFVFFTMLFNGGLVPTYYVYTQIFDLKNSFLALIIPYLLLNGFYVLLARTFFMTSIPVPIIESAYIDGAGEFKIFYKIVLPLSLPILATIGLFQIINYWNDWFNSLIFITDSKLFGLQYMLNKILLDIQFLSTSDMGGNQAEALASLPKEGVRMAMAVIGVIPILITYPFFQKFFVKGLTVGAVKG
ncbi:L-arabinose transport system permease protein AraQ [Paenibacillus konkukensis]|uniref:L-arabinose transport system permease protein AraQ n=1 Tax=Paenibacillus konkukensis TaxID=2020716 RepID=A0ABY4RMH1_9BACL|nr:carbohydrate ABC transporter permease [Paenibacillus konkukensis]UQZ83348.1 L-arabinose transport system permease protein AraQ [Paenibacillus konkukensis]